MSQQQRTVLIVDDSPEDRILYQQYLQAEPNYHYTFLQADCGKKGLELWQQHKPDIMLANYQLPDFDAIELLIQLQTGFRRSLLPVIVIADQGNEVIAVQSIKAGAQDYLVKERITPKHLQVAVNEALENYLQEQNEFAKRQHTEEILRHNEEKLRVALEAARMGTWDWNIQTGDIQWSTNLEAMFGLAPGEFDGSFDMFVSSLHPDDRDRVLQAINNAITNKADYTIEFRVVYPNGIVRWALSQGKVFYNQLRQPVRMTGVDLDITDRKRAETELQENQAWLKLGQKATKSGLWDWDIPNNIAKISEEYCDLFELDNATKGISFEDWLSLIHPDDRTIVREYNIGITQQQQEDYEIEYRVPYSKGIRWLLARGKIFYDKAGNAVRIFGNVQDISDYKQAQEELQRSEARYRYLAEAVPQMVWTCNADGSCDYINKRFCEYTGLTVEQSMGLEWLSALHPDDVEVTQEVWWNAVKSGTDYKHEYRVRRGTDGSYRWHMVLGVPLKDEQGRVVQWFGTCTDIHEQKELDIERDRILQLEQAARAEAERANRIKDEFLAILSHELRSPLNPIIGWVSLLQTRKLDATKTAQALATIERNAKLQTQLIDDLLDIARILRGKLSLNTKAVNLASLIEGALDTVRSAAAAKSILIHSVLSNTIQVSGDSVRLQQIIWNLLSNAIKFTPRDGKVEIRLEQVGNQAQITVSDTGKGIAPDFLPHIFDSFRQEDISVTRQHGGLGLGLAIVRHLTEAHGGSVTADSPGVNLGATFTVSLPILNIQPEINLACDLLEDEPDLTGIRVLTVDDQLDARELLKVLLPQYGADVMAVASGTEFLAALESFEPDILLSDIGMPEMDGYTLLTRVRSLTAERYSQIPAIALTAYAGELDEQQALSVGFQKHLAKPIEPYHLVHAIAQLVGRV
ncbi:PAS domain-containing protein [Aetokthonos hydrillicola Thurmond2011]|jgi:PAS domain S-box-containing protein|uniref:histidine kinase n=1 Tax=Aetokthonos hydrillicola Thurmond2011 TaxID=2712845 RepID=A0AAP5M6C2_9CYAN|nr:PAS domain-containing protein [Aetokthonos hydrillicola]MBO3460412.1 PAS domain-containing protein [Aetokthonos hydrillicola CCALA 1050]MBW4588512.1 PAS domain-containing protein [Aetokthonos hydrillicola CCALA 1050]MDR9896841.1 PAS domain-containing protein [Aetokthonos hydrillicola Thurmond2011]